MGGREGVRSDPKWEGRRWGWVRPKAEAGNGVRPKPGGTGGAGGTGGERGSGARQGAVGEEGRGTVNTNSQPAIC